MQTQPTSVKRAPKLNPAIRGRALIDEWQRSGLSRGAFARERQVGAHLVSYWARRLGVSRPSSAAAMHAADFIQVPLCPAAQAEQAAVPISAGNPSIEILFPRGVVLRVRPGVDAAFLRTVVTALEHVRC